MSDGAKGDDCCGESLTRGEFLAAGASMAAGASVGGVAFESPGFFDENSQTLQPCRPRCRPRDEPGWTIRAGILNAFWGDILPRLVAKRWLDETNAPGSSPIVPGMPVAPDLTGEIAALSGSSEFNARRDAVLAYLGGVGGVIPVRILGFGSFDFVLSEAGLELFLPPDLPTNAHPDLADLKEIFRYYMFRRTGRSSLGFPRYMDGPISSISLDAPTGPSQVRLDLGVVAEWVAATEPDERCGDEVVRCLALHLGGEEQGAQRIRYLRRAVEIAREGGQVPDDESEIREAELDLESYVCVVSPIRCWQLTGAVYRGILTELPRVVATIWFERASAAVLSPTSPPVNPCGNPWDGNPDPGLMPPDDSSYLNRFMRPGDPANPDMDRGMRGIFEERLETSLPGPHRMLFAPTGDPDVIVTERGIRIPRPQHLPGTDRNALTEIYTAIMNGRAGNPVFTDSKRSI